MLMLILASWGLVALFAIAAFVVGGRSDDPCRDD